jgi:predicted metal-dependent hydrolase
VNGTEIVAEVLATATRILAEVKESQLKEKEHLAQELAKAVEGLENIKGKATLRTKNGTSQAFPLKESAENLAEAWEDAAEADNLNELTSMVELFTDAAEALVMALRNRTVIMT